MESNRYCRDSNLILACCAIKTTTGVVGGDVAVLHSSIDYNSNKNNTTDR